MKKRLRMITGMTFIGLMLFVVAGCGNDVNSATQLVSEFRDYIEVKDGEGLYENAVVDEGTYWTVDEAANIVKMLKEDDKASAEIMSVFAAQGQHFDAKGDKNKAYDLYDDVTKVAPFYIDETDDGFVIRVRSYDVTIVTEPNAMINFLDEEYIADEVGEVNVGKIGPGYYELTGSVSNDDGVIEEKDSFFMFEMEEFSPTVYFEIK